MYLETQNDLHIETVGVIAFNDMIGSNSFFLYS
jgi:hypothetical protein